MSQIRACDAHGYFEGAVCPICGDGGRRVLDGDRRRRLSKFCSGALRHFPDDVGLALDDAGWVPVGNLVAAVERKYDWADREAVAGVVATDPKGRFERTAVDSDDDGRVRAAYGHSVAVDLADTDDPVPGTLYHGTAPRNVDSIRESGLERSGDATPTTRWCSPSTRPAYRWTASASPAAARASTPPTPFRPRTWNYWPTRGNLRAGGVRL